ncbi:hypothetical protein EBT31_17545, partial [bacterium]|nr:hypothetical protein [bacterium]
RAGSSYSLTTLVVSPSCVASTDITEEENERRFRECLRLIENVTREQLLELMGEAWLEEYRRVARRG